MEAEAERQGELKRVLCAVGPETDGYYLFHGYSIINDCLQVVFLFSSNLIVNRE